jgi:hypothetical protein
MAKPDKMTGIKTVKELRIRPDGSKDFPELPGYDKIIQSTFELGN